MGLFGGKKKVETPLFLDEYLITEGDVFVIDKGGQEVKRLQEIKKKGDLLYYYDIKNLKNKILYLTGHDMVVKLKENGYDIFDVEDAQEIKKKVEMKSSVQKAEEVREEVEEPVAPVEVIFAELKVLEKKLEAVEAYLDKDDFEAILGHLQMFMEKVKRMAIYTELRESLRESIGTATITPELFKEKRDYIDVIADVYAEKYGVSKKEIIRIMLEGRG